MQHSDPSHRMAATGLFPPHKTRNVRLKAAESLLENFLTSCGVERTCNRVSNRSRQLTRAQRHAPLFDVTLDRSRLRECEESRTDSPFHRIL